MNKKINFTSSVSLGLVLRYVLCLLVLIAPFLRGLFFEEYYLPFIVVVALVFILFLFEQYRNKESGFFDNVLDWAMLALLLAQVLSLITAVNIHAAILGVMRFTSSVMVFWMCYRIARQNEGFHLLNLSFYLAGVGMAVFGLLIYCGMIDYPYGHERDRIGSTLEYANTLGIYLAAVSMIGWGLIMSSQRTLIRSLLAGSNALLVMGMLGSMSRGTWFLYPFACLAFICLTRRGERIECTRILLGFLVTGLVAGQVFMANTSASRGLAYIALGFILAAGVQTGLDQLIKSLGKKGAIPTRLIFGTALGGIVVLFAISLFYSPDLKNILTTGVMGRFTNTTLQDQNVSQRVEFNKDALKIIKDHPLTGVGGGGWEALYHHYASYLYYSNKTHNHFLQTWVENGTLGEIALIGIWVAFIYVLWKVWRKGRNDNGTEYISLWGGALACFLLGAHSIIDFDMSYLAITFFLYGMMGALNGQSVNFLYDSKPVVKTLSEKKNHKKSPKKQTHNKSSAPLTLIVLGTIASLLLCIFATCFWAAGISFRSAQKTMNQDPNKALALFNEALKYDSLNASYYNQAASFMAAIALSSKEQSSYNQAIAYCQKAVSLEPYNVQILSNINQIYAKLGNYEHTVELADIMIQANPWDPGVYENLAMSQVLMGLQCRDAGKFDQARSYWTQALNVPSRVPSKVVAAGLNCITGEALLLLGDREQGEQQLQLMLDVPTTQTNNDLSVERIAQIKAYKLESLTWLIASLESRGQIEAASKLMNQIPSSDQNITKNKVQNIKKWLSQTS